MTTVLKDGTRLEAGNKSFHYFIEDKETGQRGGKFTTYDQCDEERQRLKNPDDFKIVGDWVLVRG